MNNDDKIISRLKNWQIEPPSDALADRIVRFAVNHKQKRSLWSVIEHELECAFTQWNYKLAYKLASISVCAVIGFSCGLDISGNHRVDVGELAFSESTMGDSI